MTTTQALVKTSDVRANGNGFAPLPAQKKPEAISMLTDDFVTEVLAGHGIGGWLRAARVVRVLGLFSLYLFLDTYDFRANFNRRTAARLRDEARAQGRIAQLELRARDFAYYLLDRFIRVLRFVIFRGAEGSSRKEARLAKQAVWLSKSLIDLGPTFIKIGQALGTRAESGMVPDVSAK